MPFPWIRNPGSGFWDLGMGIGAGGEDMAAHGTVRKEPCG